MEMALWKVSFRLLGKKISMVESGPSATTSTNLGWLRDGGHQKVQMAAIQKS